MAYSIERCRNKFEREIKLIKTLANAKINLSLDVIGKRNDNYHLVRMVMQSIDLHDVVTVSKTSTRSIELHCDVFMDCPVEKNFAYIAAKKFFDHTGVENPGISIEIHKNIPMCAGLAGGSSDAAATLVALDKLFNAHVSKEYLLKIGAEVGSDVPFCMMGGTQLAKGTGTTLEKLPDIPDCIIITVTPDIKVSTKEAYAKIDRVGEEKNNLQEEMLDAIEEHDIVKISKNLYNKFEKVISAQSIEKIKNIFQEEGALGSCMSGSGPTVFGIFNDAHKATVCEYHLKKYFKNVFVTHPTF